MSYSKETACRVRAEVDESGVDAVAEKMGVCIATVRRIVRANPSGVVRKSVRREVVLDMDNAGPGGFRTQYNDGCIEARRHEQVGKRIGQCIDAHLRRSAFLAAGGSEGDPKCPKGWFRDSEGGKLAHVGSADWAAHRGEYADIQVVKDADTSKAIIFWVDPDDVQSYKAAMED